MRARGVMGPVKDVLRPVLVDRAFHGFSVGLPKSGTQSIARVFGAHYRVAHQPTSDEVVSYAARKATGAVSSRAIVRWLRRRDRHLWLDLESSHVLHYLIGDLAATFAEARFILTVRDCYSWLESEINEHLGPGAKKEPWRTAYALRYGQWPASRRDLPLLELGLAPLGAYLEYWSAHLDRVCEAVPADRLLIVRTDEIRSDLGTIAGFMGVPVTNLDSDKVHVHRRPETRIRLWENLDHAYLADLVDRHCHRWMTALFPEVSGPAISAHQPHPTHTEDP